MRIKLSLDQICGRKPQEFNRLLRARGIDPDHPYRASITFSGVTIEQESASDRSAALFFEGGDFDRAASRGGAAA
jgi:hypothetical protein